VFIFPFGDHNDLSNITFAQNTVAHNAGGITLWGGVLGGDENTLDVDINDNAVTDNGLAGIVAYGGLENSSNNHLAARIRGNTVEQHESVGIETGAGVNFSTGVSNNNVLELRIERNTVRNSGEGMFIASGGGGAVANGNQTRALVMDNTVEDNPSKGIEMDA